MHGTHSKKGNGPGADPRKSCVKPHQQLSTSAQIMHCRLLRAVLDAQCEFDSSVKACLHRFLGPEDTLHPSILNLFPSSVGAMTRATIHGPCRAYLHMSKRSPSHFGAKTARRLRQHQIMAFTYWVHKVCAGLATSIHVTPQQLISTYVQQTGDM